MVKRCDGTLVTPGAEREEAASVAKVAVGQWISKVGWMGSEALHLEPSDAISVGSLQIGTECIAGFGFCCFTNCMHLYTQFYCQCFSSICCLETILPGYRGSIERRQEKSKHLSHLSIKHKQHVSQHFDSPNNTELLCQFVADLQESARLQLPALVLLLLDFWRRLQSLRSLGSVTVHFQ